MPNRGDKMYKQKNKYFNYYTFISLLGIIACVLWINIINTQPFSDFQYYHQHAITIANGGNWGDTYTSMGYPIVLALIYKIFGANVFYGKIFNVFLTLQIYVLFYLLIKKITLQEKDKKILYALFVFFPNNIFYNSLLCTEVLFTCILLGILNIYCSKVKGKYIYLGILCGIETMIKPYFIAFFLVVLIYELIKVGYVKALKDSLIILFVTAIIISPWIYRNTKLIGQFTFVSNNGGIVLYINNNSQNHWGRWMPAADVENSVTERADYKNANMTAKNHMLNTAAKKWIADHPGDFIKLGFKRLKTTYLIADDILFTTVGVGLSKTINANLYYYNEVLRFIFFIPALALILYYTVFVIYSLIKKTTKELNPFLTFGIILFYMFTSVYFITEGQARYSSPIMFFILICFYYVAKIILNKIKGR